MLSHCVVTTAVSISVESPAEKLQLLVNSRIGSAAESSIRSRESSRLSCDVICTSEKAVDNDIQPPLA